MTHYQSSIAHSPETLQRAQRALSCTPFLLTLFKTMRSQSVPLQQISAQSGVKQGYTERPLSELGAENHLLWLIQVGVLRREVDGQGITDSFRLTPLGREIIKTWDNETGVIPKATICDRTKNGLNLWLRLPI